VPQYKLGSVGKPYLGVNVKLDGVNSEGVGEVAVRSRNVFMGYLDEEKKTAESFNEDGWFLTGDLGTIDDEGYITLQGRKKVRSTTKCKVNDDSS